MSYIKKLHEWHILSFDGYFEQKKKNVKKVDDLCDNGEEKEKDEGSKFHKVHDVENNNSIPCIKEEKMSNENIDGELDCANIDPINTSAQKHNKILASSPVSQYQPKGNKNKSIFHEMKVENIMNLGDISQCPIAYGCRFYPPKNNYNQKTAMDLIETFFHKKDKPLEVLSSFFVAYHQHQKRKNKNYISTNMLKILNEICGNDIQFDNMADILISFVKNEDLQTYGFYNELLKANKRIEMYEKRNERNNIIVNSIVIRTSNDKQNNNVGSSEISLLICVYCWSSNQTVFHGHFILKKHEINGDDLYNKQPEELIRISRYNEDELDVMTGKELIYIWTQFVEFVREH